MLCPASSSIQDMNELHFHFLLEVINVAIEMFNDEVSGNWPLNNPTHIIITRARTTCNPGLMTV
jgi:hypothetical protein